MDLGQVSALTDVFLLEKAKLGVMFIKFVDAFLDNPPVDPLGACVMEGKMAVIVLLHPSKKLICLCRGRQVPTKHTSRGLSDATMDSLLLLPAILMVLLFPVASSFLLPNHLPKLPRRNPVPIIATKSCTAKCPPRFSTRRFMSAQHTWSPQDLTQDIPGLDKIPDDDYVKQYQENPELWPVEFFLIVYRRTQEGKTQVLVRPSANGTSKYGVGTGVPATRWMLSTGTPPRGYQWSDLETSLKASNFPEFPKGEKSWTYKKIDMCEDAFNSDDNADFTDPELEEFARTIRNEARTMLVERLLDCEDDNLWDFSTISVVLDVLADANSVAAIQGTLRMSGLFALNEEDNTSRYLSLETAPAPAQLAKSLRIYTMFPQMPDPMPLPSASAEELQQEIATRDERMAATGRDPHKDQYGRTYTHKSTSNVSNTIHGVYFTLDATNLPQLEKVPALDLFGTKQIPREWVSLQDLKVLDAHGDISTEDTKPTFISGFIVRRLLQEGVIDFHG